MAMRKSTITYLLRYLMEHTDEEHPATAPELERMLKEAGQDSDRRTIRKDIEELKRDGYDLVILERNGVMTRYYYAGEKWEPSEVRVLIDAVSSAQFITARKTGQMIRPGRGEIPEGADAGDHRLPAAEGGESPDPPGPGEDLRGHPDEEEDFL